MGSLGRFDTKNSVMMTCCIAEWKVYETSVASMTMNAGMNEKGWRSMMTAFLSFLFQHLSLLQEPWYPRVSKGQFWIKAGGQLTLWVPVTLWKNQILRYDGKLFLFFSITRVRIFVSPSGTQREKCNPDVSFLKKFPRSPEANSSGCCHVVWRPYKLLLSPCINSS